MVPLAAITLIVYLFVKSAFFFSIPKGVLTFVLKVRFDMVGECFGRIAT